MTPLRKHIITLLLQGYYLLPWKSHAGNFCYRLYTVTGNPVATVRTDTIKTLDRFIDRNLKIWKRDSIGRMTLNLSTVRQLSGKTFIKQEYKKIKHAAVKLEREGIGIELNPTYFLDGCGYCTAAENNIVHPTLFDLEEINN